MDKKEFNNLITDNKDLSEKQLKELDRILEENPYFATARLLKIRDLIRKKDPSVLKELSNSSLFLHDKNVFYDDLISIESDLIEIVAPAVTEEKSEEKPEEEAPKSILSRDFTNEILDEIAVIGRGVRETVLESFEEAPTPKEKADKEKPEIPEKTEALSKTESEEKKESPKAEVQPPPAPEKKEEKSIAKEVAEEKPPADEPKSDSPKTAADEVLASLEELKKQKEERQKILEKAMGISPKKNKPAEKSTAKKEEKAEKKEKEKPKAKSEETEAKSEAKKSTSKTEKSSKKNSEAEAKAQKKPVSPKAKSDQKIIEKFINSEPRLKKPVKEVQKEQKEDLSKSSTELPSNLVSENLANIFEKQGKTAKAIAIYKQLILKYPEKKSYFAQKIETLEK